MSPRQVLNAKTRRAKRTKAKRDAIASLAHADPAKTLVMTYVGKLVADGRAEWHRLENGDIRLRIYTGETFLLAETMITRIA